MKTGNKYSFYTFYAMLFFLTICVSTAQAQLAIDRIIIDFTPDKPPREDVRLVNTSTTETLYIKVAVVEVKNPGFENEKRTTASDPFEVGLLASPNKLVLPPGAQNLVRLVNIQPPGKQDRIFRVDFSPVVGELEASENGVKMMVGYEALVIVRPDSPKANIQYTREKNTIRLNNKGNTNTFVDRIVYCENEEKDSCEFIAGDRLYAGNSWEIELPGEGEVSFNLFDGEKTITGGL